MTPQEIVAESSRLMNQAQKTLDALIGRTAIFKDDYNGQLYGNSRKSLKGQSFEIDRAIFSSGWIEIKPKGYRLYVRVDRVEWPE